MKYFIVWNELNLTDKRNMQNIGFISYDLYKYCEVSSTKRQILILYDGCYFGFVKLTEVNCNSYPGCMPSCSNPEFAEYTVYSPHVHTNV